MHCLRKRINISGKRARVIAGAVLFTGVLSIIDKAQIRFGTGQEIRTNGAESDPVAFCSTVPKTFIDDGIPAEKDAITLLAHAKGEMSQCPACFDSINF